MSSPLGKALRPYLHPSVKTLRRNAQAYIRFYTATNRQCTPSGAESQSIWSSGKYKQRISELRALRPITEDRLAFPSSLYPLMPSTKSLPSYSIRQFRAKYEYLETGPSKYAGEQLDPRRGTLQDEYACALHGRVDSVRIHGRKLIFFDLIQDDIRVQIMFNLGWFAKKAVAPIAELERFRKSIQSGDYYQCIGVPSRTKTGELTLTVSGHVPQLLSPSLHTIPQDITDEGTLARFPQLELVIRREKRDLIRLRHHIEMVIQDFLNKLDFVKVSTPILAADTGGATARPFETTVNELSDAPLRLRIAQELALKKLVAADLGAVYEIGPNFRNEGLDATHNPEFTTCEFYLPYANLDRLMRMTEELLFDMHARLGIFVSNDLASLQKAHGSLEQYFGNRQMFRRLPFLPTLMARINSAVPDFRLPADLSSEETLTSMVSLFKRLDLPLPARNTVAQLLDSLASHFIEPMCQGPTFITHHPAIMSPLAKSFRDEETGHLVSARAELIINGVEYANMYEEENDPFLQAQKFLQQAQTENAAKYNHLHLDTESNVANIALQPAITRILTPGQRYYIRVLEMGLPPTGGWGCGVDRLVMLFGGARRIADVLPFGNLRNVVAMGTEKLRQPVEKGDAMIEGVDKGTGKEEEEVVGGRDEEYVGDYKKCEVEMVDRNDHLGQVVQHGKYTYV